MPVGKKGSLKYVEIVELRLVEAEHWEDKNKHSVSSVFILIGCSF